MAIHPERKKENSGFLPTSKAGDDGRNKTFLELTLYGIPISMKRKIKDIAKIERPREKMIRYGVEKLTDAELLAILLRVGTKEKNAVEFARLILRAFPGDRLLEATVEELSTIRGMGSAKSCEILACFELARRRLEKKQRAILLSPRDVWEAMAEIRSSRREHFVVFYLNSRSQEIHKEIISIGTLTESLVHPREVFEGAIRNTAVSIIVAHNHPSGNPEPSDADIAVTKKLIEAGRILDIHVVDHVIVTKEEWRSVGH